MPRVYRSMYGDAGRPKIGDDTCQLGVRSRGHPLVADVIVDATGSVSPDGGGMSVFPSIIPSELKRVPRRLIPLRLADKVPGAVGDANLQIWTTGDGPFVSGPMTTKLQLNVSGRSHGTIGPAQSMPLHGLQAELAKTQPDWVIEEP